MEVKRGSDPQVRKVAKGDTSLWAQNGSVVYHKVYWRSAAQNISLIE